MRSVGRALASHARAGLKQIHGAPLDMLSPSHDVEAALRDAASPMDSRGKLAGDRAASAGKLGATRRGSERIGKTFRVRDAP